MTAIEQIVTSLSKQKFISHDDFQAASRKLFSDAELAPLPKATLIHAYRQLRGKKKIPANLQLEQLLKKGAVRTLSGVTVITVLTKAHPCPGKCVFCPTEPGMPKSYLSNEPAAQRAVRLKFDPFEQVQKRIEALEKNGHDVDKLEIIVLGGTWSSYPRDYQEEFIRQLYFAANTFTPSFSPLSRGRREGVNLRVSEFMRKQGRSQTHKRKNAKTLLQEQKINESARYRIIGLTLETRSDHVTPTEIRRLRKFGCTRVQLGIQHVENAILDLNRRGEHIEDDIKATELLKQACFKVDHHYMPDLPGSTPDKDRAMFKRVYYGDDLQPDQVKIYPCIVNEYAQLYHWYNPGAYRPYAARDLVQLLIDIKKMTPPYVRINRLIRDIPEESIIAGNDVTNLRQLLQNELKRQHIKCRCIRCREVRGDAKDVGKAVLKKRTYRASNGTEHFLSYEDKDESKIYAFLRLRFNDHPEKNFITELKGAALVRELHVYGLMLPVGSDRRGKKAQHIGFGKRLMAEAERTAKKKGYKKIAVIAGIGTREYYRKLGYSLIGTYLIKKV